MAAVSAQLESTSARKTPGIPNDANRTRLYNLAISTLDRLLDSLNSNSHACPTCQLQRYEDILAFRESRTLQGMIKKLIELRENRTK